MASGSAKARSAKAWGCQSGSATGQSALRNATTQFFAQCFWVGFALLQLFARDLLSNSRQKPQKCFQKHICFGLGLFARTLTFACFALATTIRAKLPKKSKQKDFKNIAKTSFLCCFRSFSFSSLFCHPKTQTWRRRAARARRTRRRRKRGTASGGRRRRHARPGWC